MYIRVYATGRSYPFETRPDDTVSSSRRGRRGGTGRGENVSGDRCVNTESRAPLDKGRSPSTHSKDFVGTSNPPSVPTPEGGIEGAARHPQTNPGLFSEVVKNARLVRPYSMSMASPVCQSQVITTKGVTSSDNQGEGIKPRVPPCISAVSLTGIVRPWEPVPGTPLVDKKVCVVCTLLLSVYTVYCILQKRGTQYTVYMHREYIHSRVVPYFLCDRLFVKSSAVQLP
jgi:hypothetical protein